jgi:DNA repair exonuclease SbcCD ATPase subunit
MRAVGLAILLCLCACKNKGDADAAAPDPNAAKAQQELLARRDALLAARNKLQSERDNVVKQIEDAKAKGSDASELEKKKAELDSQLESNSSDALSLLNSKLDAIKQSSAAGGGIASREAEVAAREKAVADRERAVADREKLLVQRDFELAERWKGTCNAGGPAVVIQAPPPKGGSYTKSDVSGLIGKARTQMAKKGLINSDLPGPAQSLESEASKALNDNDTSKAYFAAAQLVATVDSINVNRPFIQAKIARLQTQIKSSKLDEATSQQLSGVLGDVMQKYSDGDFVAANRRLNQLAAMLNK